MHKFHILCFFAVVYFKDFIEEKSNLLDIMLLFCFYFNQKNLYEKHL